MVSTQIICISALIAFGCDASLEKRGVFDVDNYNGYDQEVNSYYNNRPLVLQKIYIPSPADIASAIQAAKEASSAVMAAQHRVQEAKEAVLNQQHIATHKQTQASLALQKAEAAAAVQQQEAKSAATSLVQAQQRLAHSKAEVANLQKIASVKEAHAAAIIQKSASAAEAEIQRNDEAARKISALQHSSSANLQEFAARKQGSLSATSAAVAASADSIHGHSPHVTSWIAAPKFVHINPWG